MRAGRITLIVGALLTLAAAGAFAQFEVDNAVSIAPVSIPIDAAGNAPPKTGMARLAIASDGIGELDREISELTVALTGTIVPADIAEIYVYWEPQTTAAQNGVYERGTNGEVELGTLSNALFLGETWSVDNRIAIPLADNNVRRRQQGGGQAYFYIAVDFVNGVDSGKTAGIQVRDIEYGDYNDSGPPIADLGTLPGPFPAAVSNTQIDNYRVTVAADGSVTPASAFPGTTATVLRLSFNVPDASLLAAGHVRVQSIRLRQTGTGGSADLTASSIRVFTDDGDGEFSGDPPDTVHGAGTLGAGGYATINLSIEPLYVSTTTVEFYVSVDISSNATEDNTIGFEIENPSSDIVFADGVVDIQQDAYVTGERAVASNNLSFEYLQVGFITETAATPAVPAVVTIQAAPDLTPPTVASTTPVNGANNVDSRTVITATFSEQVKESYGGGVTIEDFVTITGSLSGSIGTTTDGTFAFNTSTEQSFTFTKTARYEFTETVTVTINGQVEDRAGNPMGADYVFTFTIQPDVPPTVLGWVPVDGATGVNVGTTVSVIFSESMDEATVTDPANFSLRAAGSSTSAAGVMTYSAGANTGTFAPDEALRYATTYTATVTTGMIDNDGSSLTSDVSMSFTTAQEFPDFAEPIVTNNRIRPGSEDPVRIFITTPAGFTGNEPVSIQIFTATGRRVATLTAPGETFSEVIARQPIVWDGTGGRGQGLGPGLYFVQIRSGDYRRALRLLIVR